MKPFHSVACCCALLCFSPLAVAEEDPCAQPRPEEMAKEAGVELPRYPWHVANIWWDLEGETADFESVSVTLHIDRDVPESYNLYIAPVGVAMISGMQCYGGIQSNVNGWAGKESRERVHPGRGAIFSRWSNDKKTPIGLDHVRTAAPECLVESAGYEGEFASVRRPIKWGKGEWTYEIRKGEREEIDGRPHTWFECRVKGPDGAWQPVGQLRFEGETFTFWPRHSAFVEVYATAKIPRSGIPKVNIRFDWPRLNGQPAKVRSAHAFYPDKNTQGSPDCAVVKADGSSAVVEVGPIFKRDEAARRHPLELKQPEE